MGNPIASHDIYCAEKCSMGVNETLNELLICIVMLRQLNFGRFLPLSALSGRSSFVLGNAAAIPIRKCIVKLHLETEAREISAFLMATLGYWCTYSENFSKRFDLSCPPPGLPTARHGALPGE